jgi:hypothetical protein
MQLPSYEGHHDDIFKIVLSAMHTKSAFEHSGRHCSDLIRCSDPKEWPRDRIFPTTCVSRELLINLEESTSFDITVLKFSISAFAAQRKAILWIPHSRAYLVLRPDMHFMMAL